MPQHFPAAATTAVVVIVALLSLACGAGVSESAPPLGEAQGPGLGETEPSVVSPTRSLAERYAAFRDAGCNTSTLTSVAGARALRNLPFAIAGKAFTSPDLAEVFAQDGDWYTPADGDVTLDTLDTICVSKLSAREELLKTIHCIDAESVDSLTRNPQVLGWHLDGGLDGFLGENDWAAIEKNDFDACDAPQWQPGVPEGAHMTWTVRVVVDASPDLAATKLFESTLTRSALFVDEMKAQMLEDLEALGEPAFTCLSVEARGEHWHPEEYYPWARARACCGAGPFMDDSWVCAAGSAP